MSSKNDQVKLRQIFGDAKQRIETISAYVTSQNLVVDDPAELGEIKKAAANELYDIKVSLDETIQSKEKSTEESGDFFRGFFYCIK